MARPPFCFLCFSPFSLLLFSKSERWGRTTRNIQMRASTGNSDTNPQSTTKELWLQKKQSLHKEESVIEGVVMTNQGGLHTLITVGRQTTLMRNFFKNGSNEGRLQCLTRRELLSGLRPIRVSPKRSKEWTPIGTGDEKHTRIMGKRPSRPDV